MKNLKKGALFGLLLLANNGMCQMTIPDNYNSQTIPISSAAYSGTYVNKSFTTSDFNNLQALSEAYSGLPKVSSINANATGWPYYNYSPTEKWPAGAWGRGYEDGLNVDEGKKIADRDYEWYNSTPFHDAHPLIRDASFFLQGHIHLYLTNSGATTPACLQKIKDGIDYILSEQSGNDPWTSSGHSRNNLGGFRWYIERTSQFNITSNSTKNIYEDYETSHALAVLSEFYLSKIEYRRSEVLSAINLATNFLMTQVDYEGGNAFLLGVNNNTRGLGAWALSLSYKITRDCAVYNKIINIVSYIVSSQGFNGDWETGGVESINLDDNINTPYPYSALGSNGYYGPSIGREKTFHDQKIFYHFMILRGLVEAFSIIPDNSYAIKRNVNEGINKAINHVINTRTYPVNNINESSLKYLWHGASVDDFGNPIWENTGYCQWHVYSNGIEKYIETLVKLAYYAKNSIYYSTNDYNYILNLTNKIAKGLVSTDQNFLQPIGVYANYMKAINNNTSVLGWNNFTTNYNADRINGKVVNGDFDGNGLEDDVAAFYDYGNNIFGGQSSALQVWNGQNTSALKYKGDNGMWFSRYFNALKFGDRVVSGDFNNDGKKNDIVTIYDNGNGTATLWMFTSNGTSFTQLSKWTGTLDVTKIMGVVSGNYDNDSYLDDIAILMNDGGTISHLETFLYNGSSFVKNVSPTMPSFNALQVKGRMVSGDFDNDGKFDDISMFYDYGANTSEIWIFKSDNAATPVYTAVSYWTGNSFNSNMITNRVVSGDFDRDGKIDDIAAFYDYGSTSTQIWVFNSNGTSITASSYLNLPSFDANKITNRVVNGNFDPVYSMKTNSLETIKKEIMVMFNYYNSNDWENFSLNYNSGNNLWNFSQTYTNWNVQTNICAIGANKSMVSSEQTTNEIVGEKLELDVSKIYPNPFTNELIIDNLLTDKSIIKLFDMSGRLIFTHEAFENRISINTSELIQGSYLISIEDNRGVIEKKMVVKQ